MELTTTDSAVKIAVRNGRIVCPKCRHATQQVIRPDTTAENLQVFCRQCKNEFLVNIDSGQCSSSPC